MSASPRMRMGVVAAGLSCLVIGFAWAQQETEREYEREGKAASQSAGQTDRPATQSRQRHTAEFRGTRSAAGQNQEVEHHLAKCLMIKNQAEIEINEFAQERAKNPEVKQFAQQMVEDHRQLAEQLQQLAGAATRAGQSPRASSQIDAEAQPSDTTRLPGSPGAGQPDTTPELNRNVNVNENLAADRPAGQSGALTQLLEIDRQITKRTTQAMRDELQQKSGAEFDECYLGAQIGSHICMLAALEVIGQQAQGELRQVAEQAQPTIQQHLDHAKHLAKELQGASRTGASQAERQPSRTQR